MLAQPCKSMNKLGQILARPCGSRIEQVMLREAKPRMNLGRGLLGRVLAVKVLNARSHYDGLVEYIRENLHKAVACRPGNTQYPACFLHRPRIQQPARHAIPQSPPSHGRML